MKTKIIQPSTLRVLASWIGNADIQALWRDSPKEELRDSLVRQKIDLTRLDKMVGHGPLRSLIDHRAFDQIYLFSSFDQEITNWYTASLFVSAQVVPVQVKLDNPINHKEVYQKVFDNLNDIKESLKAVGHGYNLTMFLSPGTPTMATVWVLLGNSWFEATLIQSVTRREKSTLPQSNHRQVISSRDDQGEYFIALEEVSIPVDLKGAWVRERNRKSYQGLMRSVHESPQDILGFESILGSSEVIKEAISRAVRTAEAEIDVLLIGESGTGKELFARAIHERSGREGEFVPINCAAIPRDLLESELFGHKKGAFTGAVEDQNGAFQKADGGTLFLDEIGELRTDLQAKLLRVLAPESNAATPYKRSIIPVGSQREILVDVRIIAATNRNLSEMIDQKEFREDLYYRLAIRKITLPSLRERSSDIEELARHFVDKYCQDRQYKIGDIRINDQAISILKHNAQWRGNVRELMAVIYCAALDSSDEEIGENDILNAIDLIRIEDSTGGPNRIIHINEGFNLNTYLSLEKGLYIQEALRRTNGNESAAERLLGLGRGNIRSFRNSLQKNT